MAHLYPLALQNWESFAQALFNHRPPLPEFSGQDFEDPGDYLERCQVYITAFDLPEIQRTRVFEKGLKGEAEKWWNCYKTMNVDWTRYQELIRNRYDSATIKTAVSAQLFGKKQEKKEAARTFLQQKYMLYQRVRRGETEEAKVDTILNLMRPSLKKAMRAHNIVDFSDLLSKALQAERDEEEENQSSGKGKSSTTPASSKNGEPKKRESRTGPPKCWHCPDFHFHRNCPVLKKNQASEN